MKSKAWDIFNFLRHLRPRKVMNIFQLVSSFYLSKLLGRPIIYGRPMSISIEPTTACNLRCPECPSGLRSFTRPTGNLKAGYFEKMIDEVHQSLLYLIFYFQGEPYINPEFLQMVKYADSKGLYTISSTNGHFLSDENCRKTIDSGLDRLIISIDGASQETYESYRKNGKLNTVLEGTQRLINWKNSMGSRTPYIVFQFLVVRPNEQDIPEIFKLAQELGVDEVKLKSAQIYNYKNGSPLIPISEKYSRYKKLDTGEYVIKNKLDNSCWKMWHSCVITWDGKVVPCCFDKDAQHQMGILHEHGFEKVWTGSAYSQFRKEILMDRKAIDICKNCTAGCNVWIST